MMESITFPSRGHRLHGFAHLPPGRRGCPAVILCHGFTGNCIEGNRLFVQFAQAACARGFAVLRFDCLGSGNSEASFCDHTHLSGWVEDLGSAVSCARAMGEVDRERVALLGLSLGGAAAILAGLDERVGAVAGWAPVLYPEEVFRGILGGENWDRLRDRDTTLDHSYAGSAFTVKSRFVRDLLDSPVERAVARYRKPLLLLLGEEDRVVSHTHGQRIGPVCGETVRLRVVPGEDHSFFRRRQDHFAQTLDFLGQALDLRRRTSCAAP